MPDNCEPIRRRLAELKTERDGLQADLREAPPPLKSSLTGRIRLLAGQITRAEAELRACIAARPRADAPPPSDEALIDGKYLPRYRIDEQLSVSGEQQLRAMFDRSEDGWALTLYLVKYPAPAVVEHARTAGELPHQAMVRLRTATGERAFQEVTPTEGGVRAILKVQTRDQRDELFQVLTHLDPNAVLLVRRGFLRHESLNTSAHVLEDVFRKPVFFDLNLYGYIFPEIGHGQRHGLIRHEIDGRRYYQDSTQRHIFRYLPEAFKVARRVLAPHVPDISLQFESPDGLPETTQVTFFYRAVPFVDQRHLSTAAAKLASQVPQGAPALVLEPLLVDDDAIKFSLGLPRADASTGPFQQRQGAKVSLQDGIQDSLVLPLDKFQPLWDAMAGASVSALLQGEVAVDLGEAPNKLTEPILFVGRLNDTVGKLMDCSEQPDQDPGVLKLTLSNAIESTLRIKGGRVWLQRDAAPVEANLTGITVPIELKPTQQLTVELKPLSPLGGDGELAIQFDPHDIEVLPDPEAIWNAVLEGRKPEYAKPITVVTFDEVFEPPAAAAADALKELSVQFERGDTVRLKPTELEKVTHVRFPLGDVILGKLSESEYRYRVTVVRLRSGVKQGEWTTSSSDPLFILSSDIPAAE